MVSMTPKPALTLQAELLIMCARIGFSPHRA